MSLSVCVVFRLKSIVEKGASRWCAFSSVLCSNFLMVLFCRKGSVSLQTDLLGVLLRCAGGTLWEECVCHLIRSGSFLPRPLAEPAEQRV